MGNFFSNWRKRRGASRYSNDTARDPASKYKETAKVSSENEEPPPYSTNYQGVCRMAPELHGSHHTYGSMLPDGTPTFPPVDQYKDPDHLKRSLRKRKSVEDALETLRKYDTVLVVDDSGSMQGRRWEEVGALIRRHVLRTRES